MQAANHEQEKQQLALLAWLIVVIPVAWAALFGWTPAALIPQGDHLSLGMVLQRELLRVEGDWTQLLYWPGLGGGVKVHDVTGTLPVAQLLASLQVDLITFGNLQIMFVQVVFAYLATMTAVGLAHVVLELNESPASSAVFLIGLMFAFLPFLAWRITHGHEAIVIGLFVLLSFALLFLDEIRGTRSPLNILVSALALCHTFPMNAFQMTYYSLLFGGPIFVALAFVQPGQQLVTRLRWFVVPALVFLAALLISLPKTWGMLVNGLGEESSRVSGTNVVYSYTTATLMDWITSLPWSADFIPDARQAMHHHEVNYPLGPLALLILLAKPTRKLLILIGGLAVSLVMAIVLSMNLMPLSDLMIKSIPLLESFRVPARAVLPFLLFVSMLASAGLFYLVANPGNLDSTQGRINWVDWLGAVVLVGLLAYSDSLFVDVLLVFAVVFTYLLADKATPSHIFLVMALFTGGAITGFKDRTPEPLLNPTSTALVAPVKQRLLQQAPELAFPLNRIHTVIASPHVSLNSHFFWDVSSLSSYWFPLGRYTHLVMALEGLPYRPTHSLFFNQPANAGFDALNRLFNVGWQVTSPGYVVRQFGKPHGPAWLSSTIELHESWQTLAEAIKSETDKSVLLLLAEDPAVGRAELAAGECQAIQTASIAPSGFPYRVELDIAGTCYLTIAMNYSNILAVSDQNGDELTTFPAYGTLLGIAVNSDVKQVLIEPRTTSIPGDFWVQFSGLLLLLGLVQFSTVNGRKPQIQ